jgi:hypothetical protein
MRRSRWVVGFLVLCVAASASAQSRTITPQPTWSEHRVALVIGNANYGALGQLQNPINDARDIADTLRTFSFDVILRTDADLKGMQSAAREFAARLTKDGVGLFYYAGHGLQVRGNNYLVPIGAKISAEAEVEDEALDANRILKVMEDSRSRISLVVLDACRDNPYSRSFRSTSRGLAVMPAPAGTLVMYATGPGAVAADGTGRNGLFTAELLRAIRTPHLEITDVVRQVVGSVREQTKGQQVPWMLSSLDGYFYFSAPPSGGVAPASLPRPTVLEINVEEIKKKFGTPLPRDARIFAPGSDTSPAAASFLGQWFGRWSSIMDHILVVEEVKGEKARVIYAYSDTPEWNIKAHYSRVGGRLDRNGKSLTIELSRPATVTYTMQRNGTLDAYYHYSQGSSTATMTRLPDAEWTRPSR